MMRAKIFFCIFLGVLWTASVFAQSVTKNKAVLSSGNEQVETTIAINPAC